MKNFPEKPSFIYKHIFQRLIDNFYQESFETINRETSKLRTYALFKTNIGYEKYLNEVKNVKARTLVTKFRLSNHDLMIETGRHKRVPKERFCPFCPTMIENEHHFLWDCHIYKHVRMEHLNPATRLIRGFEHIVRDDKIKPILSIMDLGTCKYIAKALELRSFLKYRPKRTY